jgi:hypothetical protein
MRTVREQDMTQFVGHNVSENLRDGLLLLPRVVFDAAVKGIHESTHAVSTPRRDTHRRSGRIFHRLCDNPQRHGIIGGFVISIGFFADRRLKTVDATGGAARTLCDAPYNRGASWGSDDVIVFATAGAPLQRVSARGGRPVAASALGQGEASHASPSVSRRRAAFSFSCDHRRQ